MTMQVEVAARPFWLRVLHRSGYVATALIALEIAAIAVIAGPKISADWRRHSRAVEEQRTHETALMPTDDPWVRGRALQLLAAMPPLNALDGDGLRFVAMPSFGVAEYGVTLHVPRSGAGDAKGVLTTFRADQKAPKSREFAVPISAYRPWIAEFDKRTDGWPGEYSGCFDGTPAAFERVRGSRVTSGIGNCEEHYEKLKQMVLDVVRRYAPGDDLPTQKDDWRRHEARRIIREWL